MTIRIWPDGTWQSTDDTPYSWLSDDYEIHYVPSDTDPDDYVKDITCYGTYSDTYGTTSTFEPNHIK